MAEPKRQMRDLNALPPHDYGLIDVERYFVAKRRRQLDYISSQGCRFRCTFCADPYVFGRGWSGIDARRMGDELEHLWRRHHFDDLNFQDETYFTHRERVADVCLEILRRGLSFTWAATMRADQGVRLAQEDWRWQAQRVAAGDGGRGIRVAGDDGLAQEGHQAGASLRDGRAQIRHQIAGIFPFIVGFPDETDESVEATLSVIERLRRMSPTSRCRCTFTNPTRGPPLPTWPGSAAIADRRAFRTGPISTTWAPADRG